MEGAEEADRSDDSECEDLRQKILERLMDVDSSEGSDHDEDSFQIRLSCIMEDDETDSSAAGTFSARDAKQQIPKNDEIVQKFNERDKQEVMDTQPEPEPEPEPSEYIPKKDSINGSAENLIVDEGQVQITDLDEVSVKNLERTDEGFSEEIIIRDEETDKFSTLETNEKSENPSVTFPDEEVEVEGEVEGDAKLEKDLHMMEEEKKGGVTGILFKDVHIRGVLQKEYNPPVPPETYLWEEIKRSREKGGYPWTYLDKPPSEEDSCTKPIEHEYEPVDPPPYPSLTKTEEENAETEKRFVRIPLDSELVVKEEDYDEDVAVAEEAKSLEDSEVERIAGDRNIPDQSESRYLAATPTTTASQSRTDCDVNTSMLDSSGLEDLPLNRGSRNKKAMQSKSEQMRAQAHGIHQKLRSQAGKLRNKLRSLPKPSFNLKEKNKTEAQPEKTKTRSSRFTLPDRSKFKLPERPKFNLPERPKINLPSFGKSKAARERPTGVSSSGSRKNIFDIDFKTYPRIFSKKSRDRGDYATSSPKPTRGNTPPPVMRYREPDNLAEKKAAIGQKWIDDIKYADADDPVEYESRRSEKSESLSDFRDKDLGCVEDLEVTRLPPGRRTVSTKSSLSHLSEREIQSSGSSEDRLRKGVLEEIDSDQFFLRQKGISQEDIDMGKYLSREIREAFKSPVANALAKMDYDYDAEIENIEPKTRKPEKEPSRPSRTRSLKKGSRVEKISDSDPGLNDPDYYKTYPPRRPSRRSRSRSKGEDGKPKPRYENEISAEGGRYENVGADEDDLSEYYKSPGSIKEYEHYKVPRSDTAPVRPIPIKRKSSSKDRISSKKKSEGWVEVEIETSVEEIERAPPPRPLTRRKSQKQKSTEEPEKVGQEEIIAEPDYIVPAAPDENAEKPPVPPKRTRSMSRGSRSLRSLKLQDDENERALSGNRSVSETEIGAIKRPEISEDEASLGYATVGKPILTKPERHKKAKPPRPPPPRRKRDLSAPYFNTLPKRVPVRPMRNYSTLGPSRPPRKRGVGSAEHLYTGDTQSQAYVEIADESLSILARSEDLHGSTKDLQTEEVIEKMKGRPLPPPPRPPRQKSRGPDEKNEENSYPILTQVEVFVHDPPPGTEIVEEVCVSTQTDPLPEDSCLETDEDFEAIQEFSHEQLRLQEAFLQEMKDEEERIRHETAIRRRSQIDLENSVISQDIEVIKRLEEIVAEERRLFAERQKTELAQAEEKRLAKEKEEREKEEQALRKREEEARAAEAAAAAAAEEEKRQAEELRIQQEEKKAQEEKKKLAEQQAAIELDLGYASLDRRQLRPDSEPVPSTSSLPPPAPVPVPVYVPVLPDPNTKLEVLKTEKLQIKQLDVERLNVNELQANRIRVEDMQSTRFTSEDITTRGGNLVVGNMELPADFVRQILASIPWDEIGFFRERSDSFPRAPTPTSTPVESVLPNFPPANLSVPRTRSPRRRRQNQSEGESEEDNPFPTTSQRRTHRRRYGSKQPSRYSSEEEQEEERRELALRRHFPRSASQNQSVMELSRQLARACASAGVRTARNLAARVRTDFETVRSEEKALYVQAVLCIAIVLVAGFFLLGFDSKAIYHYHWDFQFPPRPPPHGRGE